jgi:hypothetical protein
MFERYTESARRVLFFARWEVSEAGSSEVGPEHILLGLIQQPEGLVVRIFAASHVSLETIRRDVKASIVPGPKISTSVEVPFSADAQRVILAAVAEADNLRHDYVGTEHLLLALLTVEGTLAATTLTRFGLRADAVRMTIVDLTRQSRMILVAGPYRSGTDDDPARMAANVRAMEAYALPLFRAGHIPLIGEWFALPLVALAGSRRVGDDAFNEIFHPIAERLIARCDAVLRVGGPSSGADLMVTIAKQRGIPVYFRLRDVPGCEGGAEPEGDA